MLICLAWKLPRLSFSLKTNWIKLKMQSIMLELLLVWRIVSLIRVCQSTTPRFIWQRNLSQYSVCILFYLTRLKLTTKLWHKTILPLRMIGTLLAPMRRRFFFKDLQRRKQELFLFATILMNCTNWIFLDAMKRWILTRLSWQGIERGIFHATMMCVASSCFSPAFLQPSILF